MMAVNSDLTNRADAQRFLDALHPTGRFTFSTLDDDKDRGDRRLIRTFHGTLEEHIEALSHLNSRGAGVFVCVNETNLTGRKDADILRVRSVFVDLDGAPLQPVLAFGLSPHAIIRTSEGRWHAYWFCELPVAEFTPTQKAIAAAFGGDPSISNLARIMRLPGFYHRKPKGVGVADPLVLLEPDYPASRLELPPYSFEQIRRAFPAPSATTEEETGTGAPAGCTSRLPIRRWSPRVRSSVGRELDLPIAKGQRNNEMTRRYGFLVRRFAPEKARRLAQAINAELCNPPLADRELMGIFQSIDKRQAGR